jgi:hypothetical protein
MNSKWLVSIAAAVMISSLFVVVGGAQQARELAAAAAGDTNCVYTFSSGQNATAFTWCLSSNGNIMRLENAAWPFNEHIRVGTFTEGYAICDWTDDVVAYDYGSSAAGFGPTTVVSGCAGGALPCTMERETSDGNFYLKMVFNRTPVDREIVITETVKNLRNIHTDNVELWRYADVDVNASTGNDWGDRSQASSWARDVTAPQAGQRVGLSALTRTVLHSTNILGPTPPTPNLCVTSDPGPLPHYGDIGIFVSYDFDQGIAALKSKTVKFQYRVD